MVPKRTTIAAALAVAAGVLTLRSVRKRRAAEEEAEPDPVVELRTEAMEASDHASAALSHARAAAEHAVQYGRQEYGARAEDEEPEQTRLVAGRFR